jgi:acyl-homoserine-lactone acylase
MSSSNRILRTGVCLLLGCTGCGMDTARRNGSGDAGDAGTQGYHVTIRETGFGIPHVRANDLASAAAGLGWVGARDYGCILLDQIVRVRSERAKYFGPGDGNANVDSDFGMLALSVRDRGQKALAAQTSALRKNVEGYLAGFNYYMAHEKLAADCDGKPWAKPLQIEDLFAYYYWLAQLASDDPLFAAVASAAPPPMDTAMQTAKGRPTLGRPGAPLALDRLPSLRPRSLGSNGWAIGKDRTDTGRGMLVANPHFPWEGNRKFYESHITVPGLVNVYGASLLGAPVINIGFNEHIAWTHTVTTARHFTLYRLDLAPSDPTSYLYDGKPRAMERSDFSIRVMMPDGSLEEQHRTMYRSHYGPMLNIPPLGGWSATTGYTYRNANADNFGIAEQWLQMDEATSLDALKKVNEKVHGIPWVNTMAVDADGNALYLDASRTPNLSPAALADYVDALANDPITKAVDAQGGVLLDGSDSKYEWQDDGKKGEGLVSVAHSPVLERTDFVFNSNDSYWLTNPDKPLTGFSRLFGDERTPRSPRTRMNMMMLMEKSSDGVSGADGKFSFDELTKIEFNDRTSLAEIIRDQVVARCKDAPKVTYDGAPADVSDACAALEAWDGRFHLDSAGALLFREFLGAFPGGINDKGALFDDAFDADDPVATPHVLAAAPADGDDPVLVALARATALLKAAGLEPTTTVRDAQYTMKGSEKIPIHGATNLEGAFNIVDYNPDSGTLLPSTMAGTVVKDSTGASDVTGLARGGYVINNGSSFMLALEYTDSGPHGMAVLSYSESSDPASEHYSDQTKLFSGSSYRPVLFAESDILTDPDFKTKDLDIP